MKILESLSYDTLCDLPPRPYDVQETQDVEDETSSSLFFSPTPPEKRRSVLITLPIVATVLCIGVVVPAIAQQSAAPPPPPTTPYRFYQGIGELVAVPGRGFRFPEALGGAYGRHCQAPRRSPTLITLHCSSSPRSVVAVYGRSKLVGSIWKSYRLCKEGIEGIK